MEERIKTWAHDMKKQEEIIHCTECKYYSRWDDDGRIFGDCMMDNFPHHKSIPDGWYCAGGVRKDEHTKD